MEEAEVEQIEHSRNCQMLVPLEILFIVQNLHTHAFPLV